MSEDEVAVVIFAAIISLVTWIWWYGCTLTTKPALAAAGRRAFRSLLLVVPVFAAGLLFLILQFLSAHDVRDDGRYLFMYMVLGMAWCGVASFILPWMGISFRHDALARANQSAAWICSGWIVAVMLSFAGANIGDGPGWWVVFFSAFLSTGMLTVVFVVWEKLVGSNDAVTIDRDVATGLRMLGLLVGCGAVFGVSAAGDWHSVEDTTSDFFLTAWPAVPIFLVALVFHGMFRPMPESPRPSVLSCGVVPMLLLLLLAGVWVASVGSRLVGDAM